MRAITIWLIAIVVLTVVSGCFSGANHDVSGTVVKISESKEKSVYVIVGAAVITINNETNVVVVDETSCGVGITRSNPINNYLLGFKTGTMYYVPTNENVLFEYKKNGYGNVKMNGSVFNKQELEK